MSEKNETAVAKSEVEISQLPDVLAKRGYEFLAKYVCREAKSAIAIQEVQISLHAMDFTLKDVLKNRCYVVPFYDKRSGQSKFKILTSIHELIARADATGKLDGIETETDGGDGQAPTWATATIYRKDCARPFKAKVYWSEYAEKKDGKLTKMWEEKSNTMLEKVATSHGLHLAFAAVLMNLFSTDEFPTETMGNSNNGKGTGNKEPVDVEVQDVEVQDAKARAKALLDDIKKRKERKAAKKEQIEDVTSQEVDTTKPETTKPETPKPEVTEADKPLPAQIVALQKLAERIPDEKAKAEINTTIKAIKTRAEAANLIKDLNALIAGKPKTENGFLPKAKELRKFFEDNGIIDDFLSVIGGAGYETEEQVPVRDQAAVLLALQQIKKDYEALVAN